MIFLCLGLTCVVRGTPSKNPATATDSVTTVLFLMIQSVPISSTMAVTSVSSRQNYKKRQQVKELTFKARIYFVYVYQWTT